MTSKISINNSGYLLKNDKKLIYVQNDSQYMQERSNNSFVGKITSKKDIFDLNMEDELETNIDRQLEDRAWLIVRHSYFKDKKGYKIREGDIMKLGKVMFKVKEVKIKENFAERIKDRTFADNFYNRENPENDQFHNLQFNEFSHNNFYLGHNNNNMTNIISHVNMNRSSAIGLQNATQHQYIQNQNTVTQNFSQNININQNFGVDPILILNDNNRTKKKKKKVNANVPICRICLCDDYDLENPLINPCKCSGTMKYIHLLCLRQW